MRNRSTRSTVVSTASLVFAVLTSAVLSIGLRAPSVPGPESLSSQLAASGSGTFTIAGDVTGLAPGVDRPVILTMANPTMFHIEVMSVGVTVQDTASCPITFSSAYAGGLIVDPTASAPASVGFLTLSSSATDACQGAQFPLTYTGTAIKAADIGVAHVDLHGDLNAGTTHDDVDVRVCNLGDMNVVVPAGTVTLGITVNGAPTTGAIVLKDPSGAQSLHRDDCKDWHFRWDPSSSEMSAGNTVTATGTVLAGDDDRVATDDSASETQTVIKPKTLPSAVDTAISRVDPHGDVKGIDAGHNDVDVVVCNLGKATLSLLPSNVSLRVQINGVGTAGPIVRKDPANTQTLKGGECQTWHFRWDYAPGEVRTGFSVSLNSTVTASDSKPLNNSAGVRQSVVKP